MGEDHCGHGRSSRRHPHGSEGRDGPGQPLPREGVPGGESPSEEQPFFTGLVVVSFPEGDFIGGKADKSTARRFTFNIDWPFVDKPERVTS